MQKLLYATFHEQGVSAYDKLICDVYLRDRCASQCMGNLEPHFQCLFDAARPCYLVSCNLLSFTGHGLLFLHAISREPRIETLRNGCQEHIVGGICSVAHVSQGLSKHGQLESNPCAQRHDALLLQKGKLRVSESGGGFPDGGWVRTEIRPHCLKKARGNARRCEAHAFNKRCPHNTCFETLHLLKFNQVGSWLCGGKKWPETWCCCRCLQWVLQCSRQAEQASHVRCGSCLWLTAELSQQWLCWHSRPRRWPNPWGTQQPGQGRSSWWTSRCPLLDLARHQPQYWNQPHCPSRTGRAWCAQSHR